MPPKKGKIVKKRGPRTSDEDEHLTFNDVQYNPDIIESLLENLEKQVEVKCNNIQSDTNFMIQSIQQAFKIELIKLPKNVQQMSVTKFREEFGDSLEAFTRNAMASKMPGNNSAHNSATSKENNRSTMNANSIKQVFQTPSHKGGVNAKVLQTPSQRGPREGEIIQSANGSPLGEFTVKKAPRNGGANNMVPPTPGVFVPIAKTGEIVDLDSLDVEDMDEETRADTLGNIQEAMGKMQALMAKLQQSAR